jgi:glycine/serine hydroxymethyltransferase
MGEREMERIAELIDEVLTRRDEDTVRRVRGRVEELAGGFPLYQRGERRALVGAR